MAKIRHISYRAENVEAMAKIFRRGDGHDDDLEAERQRYRLERRINKHLHSSTRR